LKLDLVVKRSTLTFALPIKKGALFKGKDAKKKTEKSK
jgi:hypothetical protein